MNPDLIDEIVTKILKKRHIKYQTALDYVNLVNKLMLDTGNTEFNYLKDYKKVFKYLQENKQEGNQRRYLTSIIVVLDALYGDTKLTKDYREILARLVEKHNEQLQRQEKTEKQTQNWTSLDDLKNCMLSYEKELKANNTFRKKKITDKERQLLTNWLVTALYVSGNAPRRLEYRNLKIIHVYEYNNNLTQTQRENSNYLVRNGTKYFFSLADYKTYRAYGIQILDVNKYLKTVLDKYLKYNTNKHLLFPYKPCPVSFSRMITKAFEPTGKNITLNLIRHIYITANIQRKIKLD
jgi:hypothetical protein